jgi:hypothetical protein
MVHIELKSAAREPAGRPQSRRSDLNGALTGDIEIDTSAAATDTIDYVATDGQGAKPVQALQRLPFNWPCYLPGVVA